MFEEAWDRIKGKKNVVGYSKKLRKRIREGKEVEEEVIRIYVSEKVDSAFLDLKNLIPGEIDGVPTDIVEIGDMKALSLHPLAHVTRVRPLVAGVSIGNWAITAGTLGWFFKDGKGSEMLGSNAHVFAKDPLKSSSLEKRIVQPGRFDQGRVPEDIVGTYHWHQPLDGSECPVANPIVDCLNWFARAWGAKTRFNLSLEDTHKIDFAVAVPTVDYEVELYTAEACEGFVGLGFAGSNISSYFCKGEHIRAVGWTPIDKVIRPTYVGETIHKIGRTTEYTSGNVIDDSAYGRVDYGGYNYVEFDDLILTTAMLEGGDSGDSAWESITLAS